MPCNTCVDEKRCDRAGLCQDFAHAVLDSRKPARPDCFERAMDFLGDPEATALLRYIEALERAAGVVEVRHQTEAPADADGGVGKP